MPSAIKTINSASVILILSSAASLLGVSNGVVESGPENVVKLFDSTAMLECVREAAAQWYYVNEMNVTSVTERYIQVEETDAKWRKSENKSNHELYIDNLRFDDAGLYYCAPKNNDKFPGKAAYIVTVAHPPFCFAKSTAPNVSTLNCWITYRGIFDVRLMWKNDDGHLLAERNFTSRKMGLSSFNLPMRVSAFYEELIYTCEVQFIIKGMSSDMSFASNAPTFDEGVCETSNMPAKLRARMSSPKTVVPTTDSTTDVEAHAARVVVVPFNESCAKTHNALIASTVIGWLLFVVLGIVVGILVMKQTTKFSCCDKQTTITVSFAMKPTGKVHAQDEEDVGLPIEITEEANALLHREGGSQDEHHMSRRDVNSSDSAVEFRTSGSVGDNNSGLTHAGITLSSPASNPVHFRGSAAAIAHSSHTDEHIGLTCAQPDEPDKSDNADVRVPDLENRHSQSSESIAEDTTSI